MPQKEKLTNQYAKLHEIKTWITNRLCEENDRQVRDALFAASQAIGLAMLNLEEVEYNTKQAELTAGRMDESR